MLHLTEMYIPDRAQWGGVYQKDIIVPNRIKRIKAVMVNAVLDRTTPLCWYTEIDREKAREFYYLQIGEVSVSVGGSMIAPCLPLVPVERIRHSKFRQGVYELEHPFEVAGGSMLRMVAEERVANPFFNPQVRLTGTSIEAQGADIASMMGLTSAADFTNSYTIKLYLDYD